MEEDKPRPNVAPGVHEAVLSLLKDEPRGRVLDMGAYEGALSLVLKQTGFDVTACDIQPQKFKIKDISCVYYDLNSNDIPFESNSFDIITCIDTIEHLENPWHLIRVMQELLRDGGKIILSMPNILNLTSRIKFALHGVFSMFGDNYVAEDEYDEHINPIPLWELEKILNKNGFVIEVITTNNVSKLYKVLKIFTHPILKPKNDIILGGSILIIKAKVKKQ